MRTIFDPALNAISFEQATASPRQKLRYRCHAGHSWQETLAHRLYLERRPAWRVGNPTACPLCADLMVDIVHSCGHTYRHRPHPGQVLDPTQPCWTCVEAGYEAAREEKERRYKDAHSRAVELIKTMDFPENLPITLRPLLQARRRKYLIDHLLTEPTRLQSAIELAVQMDHRLPSAKASEQFDRAGKPVPLDGSRSRSKQGWARGFAYRAGSGTTPASLGLDHLRLLAKIVEEELRQPWVDHTKLTAPLTRATRLWGTSLGGKCWGELTIPLSDGDETKIGWGRLDMVITRPVEAASPSRSTRNTSPSR